ncbi:hypothetical protein PTKIN_Ptkin08bG0105900 [Pterospermum kingtungense]
MSNTSSAPWRYRNFINHIESLKLQVRELKIGHVFREGNQIAVCLAKDGVNRATNLVIFSDDI